MGMTTGRQLELRIVAGLQTGHSRVGADIRMLQYHDKAASKTQLHLYTEVSGNAVEVTCGNNLYPA